jgi:hypothetical protein
MENNMISRFLSLPNCLFIPVIKSIQIVAIKALRSTTGTVKPLSKKQRKSL